MFAGERLVSGCAGALEVRLGLFGSVFVQGRKSVADALRNGAS